MLHILHLRRYELLGVPPPRPPLRLGALALPLLLASPHPHALSALEEGGVEGAPEQREQEAESEATKVAHATFMVGGAEDMWRRAPDIEPNERAPARVE